MSILLWWQRNQGRGGPRRANQARADGSPQFVLGGRASGILQRRYASTSHIIASMLAWGLGACVRHLPQEKKPEGGGVERRGGGRVSPPPTRLRARLRERKHALERRHVGECLLHRRRVGRVTPQRRHRAVQQLVHNALGQLLHRLELLLRQPITELAHGLFKLAGADRLGLVAQRLDRRHRLERVAPRLKRAQLLLEQQLRLGGRRCAALLVRCDHLLEIIHVVHDRRGLELADVRRHIPRHRDVNKAAHATDGVVTRRHARDVLLVDEQLL
mmetsp:Transcript_18985/g.56568  ORF Transcript_18985/g.56568 Transcript_18985/m.56568 type:complete len:273 (-) Transcript_18985:931-1749(-)